MENYAGRFLCVVPAVIAAILVASLPFIWTQSPFNGFQAYDGSQIHNISDIRTAVSTWVRGFSWGDMKARLNPLAIGTQEIAKGINVLILHFELAVAYQEQMLHGLLRPFFDKVMPTLWPTGGKEAELIIIRSVILVGLALAFCELFLFLRWAASRTSKAFMVLNRMTEEEFDDVGKTFTKQAVDELMNTAEWREHVRIRGGSPDSYVWQRHNFLPFSAQVDDSASAGDESPSPRRAAQAAEPMVAEVEVVERAEITVKQVVSEGGQWGLTAPTEAPESLAQSHAVM
eukprot:GDKH01003524.1.p1 GENE.GDKH01003524.1~~GDKH01003524.1.p1  ORF type:complete len:287 (-),score=63.38 GDKH01003524.1:333-1193(-)